MCPTCITTICAKIFAKCTHIGLIQAKHERAALVWVWLVYKFEQFERAKVELNMKCLWAVSSFDNRNQGHLLEWKMSNPWFQASVNSDILAIVSGFDPIDINPIILLDIGTDIFYMTEIIDVDNMDTKNYYINTLPRF